MKLKSARRHSCRKHEPSTDEWVSRVWRFCAMGCHSAIERCKTVSFAETWIDLETVIQSEISRKEKNKHIFVHTCET